MFFPFTIRITTKSNHMRRRYLRLVETTVKLVPNEFLKYKNQFMHKLICNTFFKFLI